MPRIEFDCLPTIIGSLPHKDPAAACEQVLRYLKDIPAWPQLPKRSFLENMYAQYSEGFPGVVVDRETEKIYVDRSRSHDKELEALYAAYLENNAGKYTISREYASGLHYFLSSAFISPPTAVKGHVTGPFSWGLSVTDENKQSIIYDDTLADAAAKLLRLKAAWQEQMLSKISPNTIIFLDEPYMTSFGSAFVNVSREKVIKLLEEVFGGISGYKGVHCCGNTDWSVLLATSADIINFDAYNYAQSFSLYLNEVKKFVSRGGVIGWGIVPTELALLEKESVGSLQDRLEEAIAPFTRNGIRFKDLLRQSLLMPSCGLGSLPNEEPSGLALALLTELSQKIRQRYL
ncbi:MAG: methionine synthase [Chloroflexi bacterium]|nr:methionine synthase [Chloroflexota bacterium]